MSLTLDEYLDGLIRAIQERVQAEAELKAENDRLTSELAKKTALLDTQVQEFTAKMKESMNIQKELKEELVKRKKDLERANGTIARLKEKEQTYEDYAEKARDLLEKAFSQHRDGKEKETSKCSTGSSSETSSKSSSTSHSRSSPSIKKAKTIQDDRENREPNTEKRSLSSHQGSEGGQKKAKMPSLDFYRSSKT